MRGLVLPLAVALGLGACSVASADMLSDAPSRFAALDGMRVHYKTLGQGAPALVFVHGWSCDMSFWRFQVPGWAARTRVILVDLPGHGRSDKPEVDYTMDLFARALDAVMRDAGVEQAVLVGHSNGTPVVRQFYRLFPKKTLALVLVEGNLRAFGDPSIYATFAARYKGPDYKDRVGKVIDGMLGPGISAELRSQIRSGMLATPQHVMVSSLASLSDPKVWADDRIEVPTLVLQAKSPFWTADYEAFVRKLVPGVDYQVHEGVGHFLMMERPDEFDTTLLAFLTQRGLLGGASRPTAAGR